MRELLHDVNLYGNLISVMDKVCLSGYLIAPYANVPFNHVRHINNNACDLVSQSSYLISLQLYN